MKTIIIAFVAVNWHHQLITSSIFGIHHQYVSNIFYEVVSEQISLDEVSPLGLDKTLGEPFPHCAVGCKYRNEWGRGPGHSAKKATVTR